MALTNAPAPWASSLLELIGEAFPHSRPDTRRALRMAAAIRAFDVGQTILRQGGESSIALVLDGHVATRRTTVDARQLIVGIVTPGALVSILPLAGRPAGSDAVALTRTTAALWHGDEVRSLATVDAGFAVDVLDHVLATYEQVVGRLDSLLHQSALRRVARVLHEFSDLFFADRPILTRAHLPIMVGTSREMTGRVLRTLESRRIVARVGRDRLQLMDPAGLAEVADPDSDHPSAPRRSDPPSPVEAGTSPVGGTSGMDVASRGEHSARSAAFVDRAPAAWRISIVSSRPRRLDPG